MDSSNNDGSVKVIKSANNKDTNRPLENFEIDDLKSRKDNKKDD